MLRLKCTVEGIWTLIWFQFNFKHLKNKSNISILIECIGPKILNVHIIVVAKQFIVMYLATT